MNFYARLQKPDHLESLFWALIRPNNCQSNSVRQRQVEAVRYYHILLTDMDANVWVQYSFEEIYICSCPQDYDVEYLPSHNKTIRFKFAIRPSFGLQEQFLFLHCQITTCRRKKLPQLTGYRKSNTLLTAKRNCEEQGQHCPHRRGREVTIGPFVMWPEGSRRDQQNLRMKSSKYDMQNKRNWCWEVICLAWEGN